MAELKESSSLLRPWQTEIGINRSDGERERERQEGGGEVSICVHSSLLGLLKRFSCEVGAKRTYFAFALAKKERKEKKGELILCVNMFSKAIKDGSGVLFTPVGSYFKPTNKIIIRLSN